MPQLVWVADSSGKVLYYNSRAENYHGLSQKQDGSWNWQPIVHEDDLEQTREAWDRAVRNGGVYQCQHRARMIDGSYRWHLSRAFSVGTGSEARWYGTATDIHELTQVQESLRESEERFRSMADGLPLVVWVHDAEGRQEFVNQTFCEFFGVDRDQMREDQWQVLMHDEDRDAYITAFAEATMNRTPFYGETRVRRFDGAWRWIESWGRPRFSASGEYLGVVGTSADITERKEVEHRTRKLNEELDATVKARTMELLKANEQLQGFTYSVAHDLRQQIRGINANASLLLLDSGESLDEENHETLRRLVASSKKLSLLVDDLLAYARLGNQEPNRVPLNLSEIAMEVASVVRERGNYPCDPRFIIASELTAEGDVSMVRLVLENLLDNACKYSANKSEPVVEVGSQGPAFFVRDNGIGFDMAYYDKLFEPFERLHREDFGGTGIGLANVKRIVEKHGGEVWASSCPAKGATFYFTLGS